MKPKGKKLLIDSLIYVNPTPFVYSNNLGLGDIYLGIDLDFGSKVYWSPTSAINSHLFIVGPSGSGKSVALSTISYRIAKKFKPTITVFDIKTEYQHLFRISDLILNEFNPLKTPIPLCFCDDNKRDIEHSANTFLKAISKIYGVSTSLYRNLYEGIKYVCSRCESMEYLYNVAENFEALNDIINVFEIYPFRDLNPLKNLLDKHSIVNLREIFLESSTLSGLLITYIINNILKSHTLSFSNIPQRIVILDELWHVAPYIMDEIVQILTRYSRGYGISIFMSTQNIDDVGIYIDAVTSNCNLLLAMASPIPGYWSKMARYWNLSRKGIDKASSLDNQGECVVRMYPYENPMFVYIDPLDE
jgi:type IV secretory pathway VirB4 component